MRFGRSFSQRGVFMEKKKRFTRMASQFRATVSLMLLSSFSPPAPNIAGESGDFGGIGGHNTGIGGHNTEF
jgi:hypothetical protein